MGAGRDPETPTGHGIRTLGDGDDGPGTRRMFDKRTLRKMYRGPFQAAIGEFAQQGAANKAKAPVLPPGGTAVYVRKRPLFPRELETDEFDIITPVDAVTVLHDCKLRADLKTPYILHRTFPLRCFPETLSNDEVCDSINLPKLIQRAIDGEHVTCCMFGQTGSGKSHTMAGILAQAARILFASSELERPPHFHAQLSCFEVCGSNCFDLLQGGDKLIVRENAALKVEVSALQVDVKSSDAFGAQLKAATANRATSSTLRNMDSSRSHAFYRLTLYASTPGPVPATTAVPPTPGTPTAGGRAGGLTSPGSARPPVPGRTGSTLRSAARPPAVSVTGASGRAPPSPTPGSRRPGASSAAAAGTPPSATRGTAAKPARPSISIPRNSSGDGLAGGAARRGASPGTAAGRTSPGSRTLASTTSTGARNRPAASPTPSSRRTPSMSSNADSPSARKAAASASRPPFDNRPLRPQEKASPSSSRLSTVGATSPGVARRLHMTPEQRRAAAATGRSAPGSARAGTSAGESPPGPRPAGPTEEEDDEVPTLIAQESGSGAAAAASPVPSPRPEEPSAQAEPANRHLAEGAEEAAAAASPSQAASPGPAASPAVASPASAGAGSPAAAAQAPVAAGHGHARSLSSGSVLGGGLHSRNASSASVFSEGKSHRRTPSGTVLMMSHSRNPSLTQLPSIDVAAAAAPVPPPPRVERGTITFVDLAGSERAWDSMYHDAEQRKQTAEINASLSCLKECFRIRSLQMQAAAARGNASPAALRVPYRDSRLTLLLRDSLQSTNSKEPCVVVVATLSPCAGDTEHTLNTLRNAITMTGLDVNHANKGETSREQEIAVDDGGSKVVRHPSRWTTEELKEWMSTVCDGKYAVAADNLTSTTDGKAIMRFAPVRFKQLCNGNARMGDDLYKLFKSEVKRANESKSQHQESVRNISNVKVFA